MKHIKKYESFKDEIGQYVVLKKWINYWNTKLSSYPVDRKHMDKAVLEDLDLFFQNNVGEIIRVNSTENYTIKYTNIKNENVKNFTHKNEPYGYYLICEEKDFDFIGTYDECISFITAKKYNL